MQDMAALGDLRAPCAHGSRSMGLCARLLTLCMLAATAAAAVPDLQATIRVHNEARRRHGVVQLTWSPRLAQQAQDWAQRCVWRHSTFAERFGTGENMYYSIGMPVQSIGERSSWNWYREVEDYDYSKPGRPKQQGRMIGHFTAMVWRTTRAFGCGYARCPRLQGVVRGGADFFVCRYDPPGNVASPAYYVANVPLPLTPQQLQQQQQQQQQQQRVQAPRPRVPQPQVQQQQQTRVSAGPSPNRPQRQQQQQRQGSPRPQLAPRRSPSPAIQTRRAVPVALQLPGRPASTLVRPVAVQQRVAQPAAQVPRLQQQEQREVWRQAARARAPSAASPNLIPRGAVPATARGVAVSLATPPAPIRPLALPSQAPSVPVVAATPEVGTTAEPPDVTASSDLFPWWWTTTYRPLVAPPGFIDVDEALRRANPSPPIAAATPRSRVVGGNTTTGTSSSSRSSRSSPTTAELIALVRQHPPLTTPRSSPSPSISSRDRSPSPSPAPSRRRVSPSPQLPRVTRVSPRPRPTTAPTPTPRPRPALPRPSPSRPSSPSPTRRAAPAAPPGPTSGSSPLPWQAGLLVQTPSTVSVAAPASGAAAAAGGSTPSVRPQG